jgi:plastocyanin
MIGVAGAMAGGSALASQQSAASLETAGHAASTVTINVKAVEFRFILSKKSVKVGTTVHFKLTNGGIAAHDFDFTSLHRKTPIIASKKTSILTIKFTKKGKFKYICSVPRHAEQGMTGFFTVTA